MNTHEALKMAIEELNAITFSPNWDSINRTIKACKEALNNIANCDLKQPAQEPVAWIEVTTHHEKYQTSKVILLDKGIGLPQDTPLYTHPAPSWQGLSDDEIGKICKEAYNHPENNMVLWAINETIKRIKDNV